MIIQFCIEHFEKTTSTNSLALDRARAGEPEGLVIVADQQSDGRGKPGRRWESPKGKNLLFSVLIRPPLKPAQAPLLTQIACRAVAKTLEEKYDIPSVFKRPNDVLVNNRKICGILIEAISKKHTLEAVVMGIGLNVNSNSDELPDGAISMASYKSEIFDLNNVLTNILSQLTLDLDPLYRGSNG